MRSCVRVRAWASTRARFLTPCPANSGRRARELVRLLGAGWGGARVVRALADTVPGCECLCAPAQSPLGGCVLATCGRGGGSAPTYDLGEGHAGTQAEKVDPGRCLASPKGSGGVIYEA